MWDELSKNIPAISATVSVIAVVAGGVFSLIQWFDVRRREQKQQRWADYTKLMSSVAGEAKIPVQMAALFQLIEFREYADITIQAFEAAKEIETAMAKKNANWSKDWLEQIAPQTEKVIGILRTPNRTE